jgi:hypothetical protein
MRPLYLTLLLMLLSAPDAEAKTPMRRFALVVAANDGGGDRQKLRYAETDAEAFSEVLAGLGGVDPKDRLLLVQPGATEFTRGFQEIDRAIQAARPDTERIELILYYSGHSDENGLLIGDHRVPYGDLKAQLEQVQADVRIAVLDSCASGAMTRMKGGTRRPPFLVDQTTQVRGYAVLASSTESEAAQESDRVGASFFTHALITGLRGAADVSKDGRVTLNEAYQFAFAETLARTSKTLQGPQHPTYDIQLVGSGDLVMTDLRSTAAALYLGEAIEGRLWVRDHRGRLVAELDKHRGEPIELGLAAGLYQVLFDRGGQRVAGPIQLVDGARAELDTTRLLPVAAESSTLRGDAPVEKEWLSVDVALFPPIAVASALDGPVEVGFALNFVMSKSAALTGVGFGTGLSWVDEDLTGLQLTAAGAVAGSGRGMQLTSGFNFVRGDFIGLQLTAGVNWAHDRLVGAQLSAGLNGAGQDSVGLQLTAGLNLASNFDGLQLGSINIAGDLRGAQVSLVNIGGQVKGLQLGLINYSERNDGAAIGLLSYARENGILSPTLFASEVALIAGGLRIGTEHMYSILAVGAGHVANSEAWAAGLGLGGRFTPTESIYLDLDSIMWSARVGDDLENENLIVTTRLLFGYRFSEAFSVYAGPTLNVGVDVGEIGDATVLIPSWASQPGRRAYLWPSGTVGLAFN